MPPVALNEISRMRSAWSLRTAALLLFILSTLLAPRRGSAGQAQGGQPPQNADLAALQQAFQEVVRQVSPSVVGIRVQRRHLANLSDNGAGAGATTVETQVLVNGCGTIISEDGLILTNEHVVQSASLIEVLLSDGQKLQATIVAADPRSDLAILHIPRRGMQRAAFCDWGSVARGQWSIVMGNPFGLGSDGQLSVSVGVIANLGRQLPGLGEVDDRFYHDMIQITAPISPGNSGGPLLNVRGELIGVVTAMHTRSPADEGIGFAIPMTPAKLRVIETLCKGQPMRYGYLGLTVRAPEPTEREGLPAGGAVVIKLEPGGPGAQAGLEIGDILLTYEGQPVRGPAHLVELAGQSPIGAAVRVEFLRAGQRSAVQVVVGQRDVSRASWMRSGAVSWRGMRLTDLSEDARRRLRVEGPAQGVVVIDVEEGSPASRARMQIGDVIEGIGGQRIQDTIEFLTRVNAVQGTLELTVRNAGTRLVAP